jgi:hypothetical protein
MIYISHRITPTELGTADQHCNQAMYFADTLRHYFPYVKFYVPAESEPFVGKIHQCGWLTVERILEIDCLIINKDCEGVIFYVTEGSMSKGMLVELENCKTTNIPYYIVDNPTSVDTDAIWEFLKKVERKDSNG